MAILVVGATGATGRLVVVELLESGQSVKAIVRSPEKLSDALRQNPNLTVMQASLLDLSDAELANFTSDCSTIVSCLGHNLTFKGMFGHPRKLVTQATQRLSDAIRVNQPNSPVKFILMNTAGNSNRDLEEPISFVQELTLKLLRSLLPPHLDNEKAADYLRTEVSSKDTFIQWVVVRPDSLVNEETVTDYEIYASPTRSALFNPGKSSRINVAHFMAELVSDETRWNKWRGQMPVLYNS